MNLRTLFLLISICWASTSAFAQQTVYPFLAKTKSDNVNIRSGQSVNFEILARLEKDQELIVLDKLYSWYKVMLPVDAKSYISAEFFAPLGENQGVIVGNRVNVRADAGPRYTVLGQLNKDDFVVVRGQEGEWIQIQPLDTSVGWVSDKYIEFKSEDISYYMQRRQPQKRAVVEPIVEKKKEKPQEVVAVQKPVVVEVIEPPKAPVVEVPVKVVEEPVVAPPVVEFKVEERKVQVKKKKSEPVVKKQPQPKILNKKQPSEKELRKARKKALKQAKKEAKAKARREKEQERTRLEVEKKRAKAEAMLKQKQRKEAERLALARKEQALEQKRLQQQKVTPGTFLSLKGVLVKNKKAKKEELQYILLIDQQPAFYIEGLQFLFDDFLNYSVLIEGVIKTPAGASYPYPVVSASKIEYVL